MIRKRLRHLYVYFSVKILSLIVLSVSRSTAMGIGVFAGIVTYLIVPKQSRKALENLEIAFGDSMSRKELKHMARRVFVELGRNIVDVLRLPLLKEGDLNDLVSVNGIEKFDEALSKGRGLIVITGHLGCWELMPAYFALSGYSVSVVGRTVYDSRVDQIVRRFRSEKGISIIDSGDWLGGLKSLNRGDALGVLIDEKARSSEVPVDFFGGQSRVTRGPVLLSMRAGAPVVPLGIHRGKNGKHIIEIGEPISFERSSDPRRDVPKYARTCAKAVEAFIQKHPIEWVWMHDKFEK